MKNIIKTIGLITMDIIGITTLINAIPALHNGEIAMFSMVGIAFGMLMNYILISEILEDTKAIEKIKEFTKNLHLIDAIALVFIISLTVHLYAILVAPSVVVANITLAIMWISGIVGMIIYIKMIIKGEC